MLYIVRSFKNYDSVFAVFKELTAYLHYILYLLVCLFRQTLLFWKHPVGFFNFYNASSGLCIAADQKKKLGTLFIIDGS